MKSLDDTTCQGKFEVSAYDESAFAIAVEALTYVSPVSKQQAKPQTKR